MTTGTMSTDALATLGTTIGAAAKRDAIHLAIDPVFAGEQLAPGTRVIVHNRVARKAIPGFEIGIVDPFLTRDVVPGERFWLVILPRTIQSLRHVWSHPCLPDEPSAEPSGENGEIEHMRKQSENWLRGFCERSACPDYEYVISEIAESCAYFKPEGSLSLGRDAQGEIPPEFWDHVEIVLGRSIPNRPTYFSCSC